MEAWGTQLGRYADKLEDTRFNENSKSVGSGKHAALPSAGAEGTVIPEEVSELLKEFVVFVRYAL